MVYYIISCFGGHNNDTTRIMMLIQLLSGRVESFDVCDSLPWHIFGLYHPCLVIDSRILARKHHSYMHNHALSTVI